MLDLAAIRAYCEAATEGPWVHAKHLNAVFAEGQKPIGSIHPIGKERRFQQRDDNAEFIAHARTDLPAVVEALEEAQQTLGAIREAAALAPSLPASTILDILGESE